MQAAGGALASRRRVIPWETFQAGKTARARASLADYFHTFNFELGRGEREREQGRKMIIIGSYMCYMVAQQDLLDKRSWWRTHEISFISVSFAVEPPCDFEPEEHCYGMGWENS